MKKYAALAIILILLILIVVAGFGIYDLKKDEIKAKIFLDNTTENTIISEQETEEPKPEVKVIKTIGTGIKRPANYTVEAGYEIDRGYNTDGEDTLLNLVEDLKNEQLKEEIKKFISTSKAKLENEKKEFEKYIENGNKRKGKVSSAQDQEINYYSIGTNSGNDLLNATETMKSAIEIEWECINGYLSICISLPYNYGEVRSLAGSWWRNDGTYDVCCATYNLYTGKKLQFSDLFFEGEDYSTEIYELVQYETGKEKIGEYIKRDFTILPQDYKYFTLSKIFFPKKNKYFSEGVTISHNYNITTIPVVTIPKEMDDLFKSIKCREFNEFEYRKNMIQVEIKGVPFKIEKIKHWDKETEEKINNNVEKLLTYLVENNYFEKFIEESALRCNWNS